MIEANNVNLNLMKTFIVVAESKSLADAGENLVMRLHQFLQVYQH